MINLIETTFIIPLYIESDDRYKNAFSVLGYLNNHFKTNVIIHELIDDVSKLDFLDGLSNLEIKHIKKNRDDENYHRTKQLNEMLNLVDTLCVVNYDIDVILPVKSYVIAETLILNEVADVVYPYGSGLFQSKISTEFNRKKFDKNFDLSCVNNIQIDRAMYGHCIFFNTNKYKQYGGENENFISYGPEDVERFDRFNKFNCKIKRVENMVYHFEHSRTPYSSNENPDFDKNQELYSTLRNMNRSQLNDYYSSIDYRTKYDFSRQVIRKTIIDVPTPEKKVEEVVPPEPQIEYFFFPNRQKPNNICDCGELKNKVRFNFCQKCGKLY